MQPPALVVAVFVFISIGLAFAVRFFATLFDVGPAHHLESPTVAVATFSTLTVAFLATWLTRLGTKERIGLTEPHILRKFIWGTAFGALAVTVSVVIPALVGATTLTFVTPIPVVSGLIQFGILAPAGIGEELLIRGLGFNALRRGIGDKAAIILSSLIFGALHILNPNSSWIATSLIALVGIWFGILVVKSGSLWMPIGAHLAWNFCEGFIYGQPVSGTTPHSSLFVAISETTSQFWSGGDFGPEAAGFTAIVLGVAIVLTVNSQWTRRRH
jgi:membrane protease YdiL (CAAX protease family)